jgi:hypothetical protein
MRRLLHKRKRRKRKGNTLRSQRESAQRPPRIPLEGGEGGRNVIHKFFGVLCKVFVKIQRCPHGLPDVGNSEELQLASQRRAGAGLGVNSGWGKKTTAQSRLLERSVWGRSSPAPEDGAWLEGKPQCELNQTRLIGLRSDFAPGRGVAHRCARGGKLHPIEEIKGFGTELQFHAFRYAGHLEH